MAQQLFSIGHSTRDLSDFIALLHENGVQRLADIRRYPGSRRYPHFSREALSLSLPAEGIEYIHMPELGGRPREGFVEPVAVGDALPDMPLFLTADVYVRVPLEATYRSAWDVVPAVWREVLTAQPGQ